MAGRGAMKLGEGLLQMQGYYDTRRKEEEERKRKAPMEELALLLAQQNAQKGGMEIAEEERKLGMAAEGRDALSGFERNLQDSKKIPGPPPSGMGPDLPPSSGSAFGGLGPISPNRYDELAQVAKSGPLKYAQESGLAKYAPYEQGVKSTLDMLSGKSTQKPGVFGYKENYDTPENRAKNEQAIDALVSSNKITDVDALIYRNANQGVGVYEIMNKLNQMATGVSTAVRTAEETIPAKIETAGGTTAAREMTQRGIQAKNPILSEAQGGALGDAYQAVDYINVLKEAVKNGGAGYFDVDRRTGQFVNPKVGDAFLQMVEIVGRKRSGAAISESEWKNFGKQILNKNNLLTEEGRKTALESLDRYLDKFYGAGVTTTGNEDWYQNYKGKAKTARVKAEGAGAANKATSDFDSLWGE
jgi:hypothetical protein